MAAPVLFERLKPLVFVLCLVPLALIAYDALYDRLGAEPVEALSRRTGDWTLRLLLLTLAVTPLRRLTGWHGLMRWRRMLGLYSFFYACLHLSVYLVLDQGLDWAFIWEDVNEHLWVWMGVLAFALLLPLALTSSNAAVRRLGGARWRRLHRLVYPAAAAAVVHFLWLVKSDLREPLLYGLILAVLLGLRLRRGPRLPAVAVLRR